MNDRYDLDQHLIELSSSAGKDYWTIRDACQSVIIFGTTGSGKTSASGKLLACKYLLKNFGGLILTVKRDEVDNWRSYCQMTGREKDLIIIKPKGKHRFNFLEYETEFGSDELAPTDNIVEVLNSVIRAGEEQSTGSTNDPFWRDSLELLVTCTIDLCKLAYGNISVQDMYDIVQSLPKEGEIVSSPDQPRKAFNRAFTRASANVSAQIEVWNRTLTLDDQTRMQDDIIYDRELLDAIPDARLLKFVDGYFMDTFIGLSDKTRSIILMSFSSFLFRLLREPFYSLFCRHKSTVTPDDCLNGKIVLIDLPVKDYQKAGRDAQMACKYVFQRAWERRDVTQNGRPVFLWVDESQHFLVEHDSLFLTTARSSRVATVFLTQNLPNYLGAMGGQKAEYRVKSLLGNFGTKILHANSDTETNEVFSKMIGDAFVEDATESVTIGQGYSQTKGKSLKLERLVRPEQFAKLRTGGPKNNFRVEGYIHRQGNSFMNGLNHMKMVFNQNYQP